MASLALAAGLVACGGDSDVSRSTFQSDLRERTTVPSSVAKCITEGVYDAYDQSEINEIYRAADAAELPEGSEAKLAEINKTCFRSAAGTK